MKIKLFKLMNAKDTLQKMGETNFDDGVTCYKIARNISSLNPEFENFEKTKEGLIKNYGEPTKNEETGEDTGIMVTDENMEEFQKQMKDILEQDIEVNIVPINPEKIKGFKPLELMLVEWMLEEEKS